MAIRAQGTVLRFTPEGEDAVTVGRLSKIGKIAPTSEELDVTTLDARGGMRTFVQGFRDPGKVELEGYLEKGDAGQKALRAAYETGAPGACAVEFPDGTQVGFTAVVKEYSLGAAQVDGAVGFGAVLRLTGPITVTD